MWYKVKHTYQEVSPSGKILNYLDYYLIDCETWTDAGYKVMEINNNAGEIEEISLLKTYKPAANEYKEGNKIFIVKVAQDWEDENGKIKTLKYPMPVFANNSDEVHAIVNLFLAQGMNDMRLTTISETQWKYINN